MLRWHFIAGFVLKIGPKSGKISYFYKNANISVIFKRLRIWIGICYRAEIWTRHTFQGVLKLHCGDFCNFDFLPLFGALQAKNPVKIYIFQPAAREKVVKNQNFKNPHNEVLEHPKMYVWSKFQLCSISQSRSLVV